MPPNHSKARYTRAALSGVGRTHRSMSPVAVIGHTIWIRSAGVIAAQASGSLSPRLPTHSAAVVARTVSPPRSCPEDSCGEDDIENDYTLRAKSMRKELRPSSVRHEICAREASEPREGGLSCALGSKLP